MGFWLVVSLVAFYHGILLGKNGGPRAIFLFSAQVCSWKALIVSGGAFWFVLRVLGTFPKKKHPTLQYGKNKCMRNAPGLANELHWYNPTAFSSRIHRCFPPKKKSYAPPSASCQLNELPKALGFIGQTGRNTGFDAGHTKEISCFLDSLRFMKNSWSGMW